MSPAADQPSGKPPGGQSGGLAADVERYVAGRSTPRSRGAASELLEASLRVLPEYAAKLDRLVQAVLEVQDRWPGPKDQIWVGDVFFHEDPNPLLRAVLEGLSREMAGLDDALKQWIQRLSALHEEGRLNDVQRLELRLRLTELELKYHTARDVFAKLKKPEPGWVAR
jgi:hypothetical protein